MRDDEDASRDKSCAATYKDMTFSRDYAAATYWHYFIIAGLIGL